MNNEKINLNNSDENLFNFIINNNDYVNNDRIVDELIKKQYSLPQYNFTDSNNELERSSVNKKSVTLRFFI